jgi:hypothetical protein
MALLVFTGSSQAASPAVERLLQEYRQQGAGPFSPARGETLWQREHAARNDAKPRSCTSCHGRDLSRTGRHVRTGKPVKPMAPSANPTRLTDQRKIRKWFRRNCKWTLGRECSPQEKGDLLNYLIKQ